MTSIREVAKIAGVSPATVSRVMNGTANVDERKKQRVLEAIEKTGFRPNELARALYKDGPFLVLDEPTAALDPIAENDIYQKYNEMTAGKSSVFISHRLASTRFCDRILFVKDGVIAEEGTHDQLLKKGGSYAKLFDIQARYYQEGRDLDDIQI